MDFSSSIWRAKFCCFFLELHLLTGRVKSFDRAIRLSSCINVNNLTFCITALAKINPLYLEGGQFLNSENNLVAVQGEVASSEEVDCLPALMGKAEVVVMSISDLQVDLITPALLILLTGTCSLSLLSLFLTVKDYAVHG